jgi:hypothetical protein
MKAEASEFYLKPSEFWLLTPEFYKPVIRLNLTGRDGNRKKRLGPCCPAVFVPDFNPDKTLMPLWLINSLVS